MFLAYLDNDHLLLQWKSLPVFVVGKATAKSGKRYNLKVMGYPLNNVVGAKFNDLKSSLDRFMC